MPRSLAKRVSKKADPVSGFYTAMQKKVLDSFLKPLLLRDLVGLYDRYHGYGKEAEIVVTGHPLIKEDEKAFWEDTPAEKPANWHLVEGFFEDRNTNAVLYFLARGAKIRVKSEEVISVFQRLRLSKPPRAALLDALISKGDLRTLTSRYPVFVLARLLELGKDVVTYIDLTKPGETVDEVYERDDPVLFERLAGNLYSVEMIDLAIEASASNILGLLVRKEVLRTMGTERDPEEMAERILDVLEGDWRGEVESQLGIE